MHLAKYPLLSSLVVPLPGLDAVEDLAEDEDPGLERRLEFLRQRRSRIGGTLAPAYSFLEGVIGEGGLQSRLDAAPAALDMPVSAEPTGRNRRRELHTSSLALGWLPSPPQRIRRQLVRWVAGRLLPRGPIPFFESPALRSSPRGCVETTGAALLGLQRAAALERGAQQQGISAILSSGATEEAAAEDVQGLFGSRWCCPPGSPMGMPDPGTVVQALFPVLLGLRHRRLRLVDPVPQDGDGIESPMVVAEAVQQNLELVREHLGGEQVHEGTRRYPSPEVLLCLATELWRTTTPISASLRVPLERAVTIHWQAVHGEELGVLERAALIIAAENLHLGHVDLERARLELVERQLPDGSFPASPYLYLEEPELYFGSRALTTIFALRAIAGQPRTGPWTH